jgi:hypothetical protein
MSRFLACCAVVLCVATVAVARADQPQAADLPLKRIVLFTSGVGFFEHAGQVNDNAKVEMKFKVGDINDLLKSMVAQDIDGGQVSTVTYGSKDPITKTLKGFAIDLTANPTLAQLLQQMRGQRVVLEAPNELRGVIVGVETRRKKIGENEIIESDVLNLLTEGGLRAVPLDTVSRIKLADARLDAELRKALGVLASAHADDKKAVEVSFLGKGTRHVRVGYIEETPVWKTTYRLVLSDEKKPFLQGWAIVENTSEADWSNVNLTLVSGRPISFTMDLYEPLYVPRPEAQWELYGSLRPRAYGQDLNLEQAKLVRQLARSGENANPVMYGKDKESLAFSRSAKAESANKFGRTYASGFGKATVDYGGVAGRGMGGGMGGYAGDQTGVVNELEEAVSDWRQGMQSAAQAGNVGNLFQYVIATPVTLPRQQSAMLPIANAEVKGEKVSIYNQNVLATHPLYGLKFTNTTDLYLMQGPITVFDGGVYAGDAKIEDIPPGGQRLISYGIDLDTEVAPQSKGRPEELLSVRLLKGTAIIARKYALSTEYRVKNSGKKAKTVLIEYPIDPSWTLVSPKKPAEKTRDLYRFAVEAKPGEAAKLVVEQERTDRQQVLLTNLDQSAIDFYLSAKVVGKKVKAALAELVRQKQELQQVVERKQQLEQRVGQIDNDQNRIRQNMDRLDRTSDLYKSYVKKLSDQETEIENLRSQIATMADQETRLRKASDEFLIGLDMQ